LIAVELSDLQDLLNPCQTSNKLKIPYVIAILFKAFIKDIQILRSAISFSENLIFDLLVQLIFQIIRWLYTRTNENLSSLFS
jgi:hypothetical protein